ncbi:MAG: hypothetical protein ACRC9P_01890 [Bacteroides sp.]
MSIKVLIIGVIVVIVLVIIGLIAYLLHNIDNSIKSLRDIIEKLGVKFSVRESNKKFKKAISPVKQLSKKEKDEIVEDIYQLILLNEKEKEDQTRGTSTVHSHTMKTTKIIRKYPGAITESGFNNNLSDSLGNSYFCFFNIENNKAEFEFCGTDIERAIANKVEIEQACEISNFDSTSTIIENEQSGLVELVNGKWKVIKKAKIKFN